MLSPLPLLDVILGYDCNLACDYCTITPEMRRRALPTQAILRELRDGRRAGYERVSFTGGEPTIRPDLLGLVRSASELGYEDVKVQSNGLLFAHEPNVRRLVDAGCNRLHVSIHTHDAIRYDRMVRREATHSVMEQGLRNAVAHAESFTADVILERRTAPDVVDAVQWLHQRGVRSVHLWFVSLTDQNRDHLESMPRMTDVVPYVRRAFAVGREHGMEVLSLHIPRCLLGDDTAHAWDPGSQQVRVVTPEATFELKDSKLAGQMHVPACQGCRWEDICPGVRPDYVEVYGDSEIAAARGREPALSPTRRLPLAGPDHSSSSR